MTDASFQMLCYGFKSPAAFLGRCYARKDNRIKTPQDCFPAEFLSKQPGNSYADLCLRDTGLKELFGLILKSVDCEMEKETALKNRSDLFQHRQERLIILRPEHHCRHIFRLQ